MNNGLSMLVWKEYRERRTQWLLCLAWVLLATLYAILYERSHAFHASLASFYGAASLYGIVAPIFLAMRTALGERTDRTRAFSDGLPIAPEVRGALRWASGWLTLVTPLILAAMLLSLCFGFGWLEQAPARALAPHGVVRLAERGLLSSGEAVQLTWLVTACIVTSTSLLYALIAIVATFLRTESHAGYAGAALAVVWLLSQEVTGALLANQQFPLADWSGALLPAGMIINYGYGEANGSYGDLAISARAEYNVVINSILLLVTATIFVWRYAQQPAAARHIVATTRRWAGPRLWPAGWPVSTPTLALIWLTVRQALPMALPGLLIAVVLTLVSGRDPSQNLADSLATNTWWVGCIWAVVVGAGLFASELDRQIGEFWRTRPISPKQLFAIKFVVGLLIVLGVTDGVAIAVGWFSPHWGNYYAMNWPYIALFVPLHAVIFSLAVACACVTRRTAVGGILTLVLLTCSTVVMTLFPALDPVDLYNHSRFLDMQQSETPLATLLPETYGLVLTLMIVIAMCAAILALCSLARYRGAHRAA